MTSEEYKKLPTLVTPGIDVPKKYWRYDTEYMFGMPSHVTIPKNLVTQLASKPVHTDLLLISDIYSRFISGNLFLDCASVLSNRWDVSKYTIKKHIKYLRDNNWIAVKMVKIKSTCLDCAYTSDSHNRLIPTTWESSFLQPEGIGRLVYGLNLGKVTGDSSFKGIQNMPTIRKFYYINKVSSHLSKEAGKNE